MVDAFNVYLRSSVCGVGKLAQNSATHFTNEVTFPKEVVDKSDNTDWEVALIKRTSTANLTNISAEHRGITISFRSALSLETFFDAEIAQHDALSTPMRLIHAHENAVLDILKLFPDVPPPKIKISDGKMMWKSGAVKLMNSGNSICSVLGLPPAVDGGVRDLPFAPCNGLAGLPFVLDTDKETNLKTVDKSRGTLEILVHLSYIQPSCYGNTMTPVLSLVNKSELFGGFEPKSLIYVPLYRWLARASVTLSLM